MNTHATILSNRQRRQQARRRRFWCRRCDAALVGEFGRCPNCSYIHDRKRQKGWMPDD